jgi:restriction endonuclease
MDMAIAEPDNLSFEEYRQWSRNRIRDLTQTNHRILEQLARTKILLDSSYDAVMELIKPRQFIEDDAQSMEAVGKIRDMIGEQDLPSDLHAIVRLRNTM